MLQNYWKFPNRNVQTFGFVYHDTNGQNHCPVWKTQSFLLNEIGIWERQLEKILLKYGWEKVSNWECLIVHHEKIILICVCGWHQVGWEETKYQSDVESTKQRSWFGRTNIFPWSCTLGLHSKTMWNKQRYCGQLQGHVWIQNFRRSNWKNTMLGKSAYLFMVLWYGGSCKELCGAILWVRKQDDSTATKYQLVASMTITSKKKKWNLLENCQKHALKLFWNAFFGTYWKTWCSMVSEQTCTIDHKMDQGLWQTIISFSYIHYTSDYKQYCHAGNNAKQCRLGLFEDSDFAGDLEDS